MPLYNHPTCYPTDRRAVLSEEGAIDIILNCKDRSQVPKFAAKYKGIVSEAWIKRMQGGRGYWKLREKLRTGWRP